MTDFPRGTTQSLTALFFSPPAVPIAVSNLTMSVISLTDGSTVFGPIVSGFINPVVGTYIIQWAIPIGLPLGQYLVAWSGDVAGDPINATETITITSTSGGLYSPEPCALWPVKWTCNLTGVSAEVTGTALEAASEVLFMLSGQRFGLCEVTLRPCRRDCYGNYWRGWGSWWEFGTYPQPALINGAWYNMVCGFCGDNCSCTFVSETLLPGPINSVTEVKVDGVVLIKGVDYRVDDYRKLVRLGGVWPRCNDLNLADTEVGTWSTTIVYGEPVPTLGQLAVGELACEFIKLLTTGECDLPPGVTNISRQGLSIDLAETSPDLLQFYAKFPISYLFLKTFNPSGLTIRPRMYDIDGPMYRATNTAP